MVRYLSACCRQGEGELGGKRGLPDAAFSRQHQDLVADVAHPLLNCEQVCDSTVPLSNGNVLDAHSV